MPTPALRRALSVAALLALPLAPAVRAQAPGSAPGGAITGRLVDGASLEPLEAATVSLWRAQDSTLVTGQLADENGAFAFEGLRPGRYFLRLSLVGYSTRRIDNLDLTAAQPRRALGDVRMQEEDIAGAEVTVTGEREAIEVGIDRTTYNVANQAVTAGGTAADVLRTVPAVELDADGNVSLRGSQNVAILINGRPTAVPRQFLAAYLRQLPAGSIEKVEVIPNPSARYEPDGMAGMLNIVLKQNTDAGLSGAVQAGTDTRLGANLGVNLNYGKGRWNTNATYGLRREVRVFGGFTDRDFLPATPASLYDADSRTEDDGDFTNLNQSLAASAEYTLAPRQTLGLNGSLSFGSGVREGTTEATESLPTGGALRTYTRETDGDNEGRNADASLVYRNTVRPGQHELVAEARYATNRDVSTGTYVQTLGTGTPFLPGLSAFTETDRSRTLRQDVSGQIDYTRPLGAFKVETGTKVTRRALDATRDAVEVYPLARTAAEAYGYDETIYAGYLTAGRTWGKWAAQLGVRAERAETRLESGGATLAETGYSRAYPSAFLTYTLAPGQTLRASYSQRVERPNPRLLNPILQRESATFGRRGNPNVSPEYTHAVELAYSGLLPFGLVAVTPYFRRTENAIGFAAETDSTGFTVLTFRNLNQRDSYGADVTYGLRLPNRAQLGLTGSLYRVVSDGVLSTGEAIGVDAVTWTLRANGSYTLRPGTEVSGFVSYTPAQETEQGRQSRRAFSNLALRQQLWGGKGSLTLNAFDPFGLMKFGFETRQGNYFTVTERSPSFRQVGLTLSYSFGQQPARRPQPRPQQPDGQGQDPLGF